MTFKVSNINVTCTHAGSDTFSGDETYAIVHDKQAYVYNSSRGRVADGTPMETGDTGFVMDPNVGSDADGVPTSLAKFTDTFSNSVVIQLMDRDLFDPNDFMGSTTYVATGKEPVNVPQHFFAVTSGDSSYKIDFDITKLPPVLKPRGKVASEEGGALNGKNIDGTLVG